jgi:HlyD family secretion protein
MTPAVSTPPAVKASPAAPGWRRRLPLLGGLVLVGLIVLGLWPRAIPVEAGKVSRGPLVVTVDEEGMTRVRNRYVVSAPVAGQLQRIDWKAGAEVVAQKTPLAVLEPRGADFLDERTQAQAEAAVRTAEAAREAAVAQRDRASAAARTLGADLTRATALRGRNVLSAQEFDAVEMRANLAAQDARAAEFALQVADFELEQARAVVGRRTAAARPAGGEAVSPLTITSPVSGKILRVLQESARVVPAGFALMEVGDPTDLEVRIEVLSRDGVAIRPGARVMLERWGGSEPLNARVRLVEPSAFTKISALGVEEQRVYVVADFVDPVERRPTLGDSYRVEARIVTWEQASALRAPAGALFQRRGEWQAYVVDGRRARLQRVSVGRSNGVETEILSGLQEGQTVVVYPGDKVEDGTRVTPLVIAAR